MIVKRDAITLVELIVSIGILAFVIFTVMSLDVTGRRFFRMYSRETELLNELSPVLERIAKDVSLANSMGLAFYGYLSANLNLTQDVGDTPWDDSDDNLARYQASSGLPASFDIIYNPGLADEETLITGLWRFPFSVADNNTTLIVDLTKRYKSGDSISLENPEVTLSANLTVRSKSAQ